VTNEILIADAPAKSLARFLTEREVQTPSGRSTTWPATTVQRMRTRWGDQTVLSTRVHKLWYLACMSLCVSLKWDPPERYRKDWLSPFCRCLSKIKIYRRCRVPTAIRQSHKVKALVETGVDRLQVMGKVGISIKSTWRKTVVSFGIVDDLQFI
jgi:hypothetical protein